jgi:hypothetical protein
MGLVAKRVADKRILKLIRAFLTAGVLADGLVGPTEEGTPARSGDCTLRLVDLELGGGGKKMEINPMEQRSLVHVRDAVAKATFFFLFCSPSIETGEALSCRPSIGGDGSEIRDADHSAANCVEAASPMKVAECPASLRP